MAFKFGTTTLQKVIFNDTDLDKVYFKNGNNAAILVFAKPVVYNGGDGTAIFGSKSFAFGMSGGGAYYNHQGYSNVNTTNMTGVVAYDSAINTYRYGVGYFVANKTFDISLYNNMTINYTVTKTAGSTTNHGVSFEFGLSTQCERNGTDPANSNYYSLAGTHYTTNVISSGAVSSSKTLALATAKQKGSAYYPFVGFTISDLSYSGDETWSFKVNSITFS